MEKTEDKRKIVIMGTGAMGSNLCANLVADNRSLAITVLDYDAVEERNLRGTQFFTPEYIGVPKVEALQALIYEWYEKEITIINQKLEGEKIEWSIFDAFDIIVDCFDNYHARNVVQTYWEESHKPILHIGLSNQGTFAIEWAENYHVPNDFSQSFDLCELEGASSFVKIVAALGSLTVQEFLQTGKKYEFIGTKFAIKKI